MLLVTGMAALMNWSGGLIAIVARPVFCYRLIFREDAQLEARWR